MQFLYNKAFAYIHNQHMLWVESNGTKGKRLDFRGMHLRKVDFTSATFSMCDLDSAKFVKCTLAQSEWEECNMKGSWWALIDFAHANIQRCNYLNAILRQVKGIKFTVRNENGKPTLINSDVHSNGQADANEMDTTTN